MTKNCKLLFILLLAFVHTNAIFAQRMSADSLWTFDGSFAVSANQVALVNWSAGGENAMGLNISFDYSANRKKNKSLWNNSLELDYGFNKTETDGTKKTSDKIYFLSTYGYEIGKNLYLSNSLGFQTQFAPGYDYATEPDTFISDFMAPGYLTYGLGVTWTPKTWLTATLSPSTYRGIFVCSDELSAQGQFGVDPGEKYKTEFGARLNIEGSHDIMENVNLSSRLTLFSDYLDKPQNVDVDWQLKINMTVNKWLSASIGTTLIYDDNVKITDSDGNTGARLQFQEILGIGLRVKM